MSGSYGSLYVHDGATAQSLSTTPAKVTGFATAGPSSDVVSGDLAIVPSLSNDYITLKPGKYLVGFSLCGAMASAVVGEFHIRTGTTEKANIAAEASFGASSAVACVAAQGIIEVTSDVNVSVYGEVASGTVNFTPVHGNLWAIKID
jgi:hypothetical protein